MRIIKEYLIEFLKFAWQEKYYWIVPMVLVFLLLGILVFFFESTTVTPFIYTLF